MVQLGLKPVKTMMKMTKITITTTIMRTGIQILSNKRKNKLKLIAKMKLKRSKRHMLFETQHFYFSQLLTPIIWFEKLGDEIINENTLHEWSPHTNPALAIPDSLSIMIDWGPYQSTYWCSFWILTNNLKFCIKIWGWKLVGFISIN